MYFQGQFGPSIIYSVSRRQNVDNKIHKKAIFFHLLLKGVLSSQKSHFFYYDSLKKIDISSWFFVLFVVNQKQC